MKHNFLKRSLAVSLAVSLTMMLLPASVQVKADSSSGNITVYYEKTAGSPSESGLQQTVLVDASGKTVDKSTIVNEDYVADGDAFDYFTGAQTGLYGGFQNTAAVTQAEYTSPYLTKAAVNQSIWGLCWAFASTAAMEANIIKNIEGGTSFSGWNPSGDSIDLSERFLGWYAHNTYTTDKTNVAYGDGKKRNTPKKAYGGGNDYEVMYALAMGSGPELEANVPYDTSTSMKGVSEALRNYSVAKLKDANMLNKYEYSDANMQTVKAMVSNYGAATASYRHNDSLYKKAGGDAGTSYYSGVGGANHEICIVGWDDNYAKENFTKQPAGNGAWYCRNSWGPAWPNDKTAAGDGYFWMSYYEPVCSVTAYDMQSADAYGRAYYYVRDAGSMYLNLEENSGKYVTAANVFQAQSDEALESVGIRTLQNGLSADVTVYVSNSPMTSPVSGQKEAETTYENLGLEGFHTIDLDDSVSLQAGQYFSVVIRLRGDVKPYMAAEAKGAGTEKKGQTYYYWNGSWVDATDKRLASVKNAAIYAYTKPGSTDTDKAELDKLIGQVSDIMEEDVPDATWQRVQTEKAVAQTAEQDLTVKRSIAMLQSALSTLSSANMYTDTTYFSGPGADGAEVYLNGGTVKVNGVSTNYKARALNFNFERTYSWVKSRKGYVSKVSGKYVAAVTKTNQKPELNLNGTVKDSDAAAAAIATAKVSGTKVTIKPKKEGDVYVWVLWYPKSGIDQQNRLNDQTEYAVTKVHVGTAPAAVKLYDRDEADPLKGDTNYASAVIPAGGSTDVYIKGTIGSISKKNMQVIRTENIGYTCTVPAKYANSVTVQKDSTDARKFHIEVADDILVTAKAKAGKTVSVTLPFVCDKNGKKANFKIVAGNPVKTVDFSAADAGTQCTDDADSGILSVTMDSAKTAKKTLQIKETTTLYDPSKKGTDGTKIVKVASADGFTYTNKGAVKAAGKLSAAQKKISITAVKKQPGVYNVTAAKGTPAGTETYFVICHNTYVKENGSGKGYKIIKVKVGEDAVSMSAEKASSDSSEAYVR